MCEGLPSNLGQAVIYPLEHISICLLKFHRASKLLKRKKNHIKKSYQTKTDKLAMSILRKDRGNIA